jgi:NADPH:quinone reductase-like Zn-dependent oxidoreductase
MRAYHLPKGGAGIDALVKVGRPDPKPAYRQVLVKVAACSLNFRDLGIVRGTYRMPVRHNIVPLSDGAGDVEVGAGVARVKVGDKVAGCFFQRWPGGEPAPNVQANALGGGIDGMLAEFVVLEEEGVVKIPAHLSLEEGATLPCAGVTALHALNRTITANGIKPVIDKVFGFNEVHAAYKHMAASAHFGKIVIHVA